MKDISIFHNCNPLIINRDQFALKGNDQEIMAMKSDLCSASDSSMAFFKRLLRI